MQVGFRVKGEADRPQTNRLEPCRFRAGGSRPGRGRATFGAILALITLLGSLVAATLGPALGEALPYPLFVLLMLTRG